MADGDLMELEAQDSGEFAQPPGTDAPMGDDDRPAEAQRISKLPAAKQFDVLKKLVRGDINHTRKWRRDARMWQAFRAGEQWTEEDRRLLEGMDRPVITFNRVLTILKAVAGMEINGRHEIAFKPRGTEDTAVNEVLTGASKWMADACDGEDEESTAFDDCATTGMGWVENRITYEENPAGMYDESHTPCTEMGWDRTAKKKGLKDARRLWRIRRMPLGDALDMFPGRTAYDLDAAWADDLMSDQELRSIEDRRRRDTDNAGDFDPYDESREVTLVQVQWIEREDYWLVADEATQKKLELTEAEYRVLAYRMKLLGMKLEAVKLRRKVYKQAFLGGVLLKSSDAPIRGKFSWDVITGEYDAKEGTWFGLVKVMRDPQMWANKWLSQILHILNSTAKGGILAEHGAFDNEEDAEESYARQDRITYLADGALSGDNPKIMPKPGAGDPAAYLGLLTFAISSIKDVTGINLELLGQQDQNQPGIIEAMRKQAGMTVLATLFDSLRRFRKNVGRSRLFFIQNFLSDGRLIRIVGEDYEEQVVQLALDKTSGEYDVVVDDTPTSPNQKEANWAIIQPMLSVFRDELMAQPEVFAMLMEYSPLPARIVQAIKKFITEAQNDPAAQEKKQAVEALEMRAAEALIAKDEGAAQLNVARAEGTRAKATFDIAMARNLLEDNDRAGLKAMFDYMEAQQRAEKARAENATAQAKTIEATAKARTVDAEAANRRIQVISDARSKAVGAAIDKLTAASKVNREAAAAAKDRAIAVRELRTPVERPAAR